ncbi:hypothetical protein F5887DRAFT_1080554 [Amanita rubescens]|nr:hypothetical protein F5887DRAFT_1080554 [Amanita rubescens]
MDIDNNEPASKDFVAVIRVLGDQNITVTELINMLFTEKQFKKHPLTKDLVENAEIIFPHILGHSRLPESAGNMICVLVEPMYAREVQDLADCGDLCFNAQKMNPDDIEDFKVEELSDLYAKRVPRLWSLLGSVLKARKRGISLLLQSGPIAASSSNDSIEHPDNDEAWLEEEKSASLLQIKKSVIVSIVLQSTNQKANTFASILGVFLHSCRTLQRVINALARMGLTVSQSCIHTAINSLSSNASLTLQELGQSRCIALAYDNFNVDLKVSVPVVEKSTETLKHLTSGLVFCLQHGVTSDDLRYSDYLWQRSEVNLDNLGPLGNRKTHKDLLQLFREPDEKPLDSHAEFNIWVFLRDLVENVEGFEYIQGKIKAPESIEQLPVVKTEIYPAYAMDVNNSTVAGNIQAIECLMEQVGYGEPSGEDAVDISKHVVLIHGDLGTGEQINTILKRRACERRPWERFQYVEFLPGYFHVKMACVDALWHIMIKPALGRQDETCVMKDIGVFCPRETGTLIRHVGIAWHLDCWHIAVQKRYPQYSSLEDFAKSNPNLDNLRALAEDLVHEYVDDGKQLLSMRLNSVSKRDQQFENAMLIQQYFLLYEELTYAMNFGDIGRLERTLLPWILLFKATGKHKYATAMEKRLVQTHFERPEPLKHAIRYNMLVNPTGKPGKFRAVDWVVEGNNCEIKVNHSGQGATRTVARMITESALIGTFKEINESIENNLHLHATSTHGEPDMRRTFQEAHRSLSDSSPHVFVPVKRVRRACDVLVRPKGSEGKA